MTSEYQWSFECHIRQLRSEGFKQLKLQIFLVSYFRCIVSRVILSVGEAAPVVYCFQPKGMVFDYHCFCFGSHALISHPSCRPYWGCRQESPGCKLVMSANKLATWESRRGRLENRPGMLASMQAM
jgi:hypothetical protein